jgi:thioredoxin-dependent peroxiredoxin
VREAYNTFVEHDTQALGINSDDLESHEGFKAKLNLPFELLVDEGLQVAQAYDALKPDPKNPTKRLDSIQRTVVIVGKDGTIIYRAVGSPPPAELIEAIASDSD